MCMCVCRGVGGGGHTVDAFSSCGLTKVLYATDFRSLLLTQMFLLRNAWVWLAFLVI